MPDQFDDEEDLNYKIAIEQQYLGWKSWIYDLENQPDVFYTIVTYKDNPFLEQSLIDEIEKLKTRDQNLWRVFGEGVNNFGMVLKRVANK